MSRYFNINLLATLGSGKKKSFSVTNYGHLDEKNRFAQKRNRHYELDYVKSDMCAAFKSMIVKKDEITPFKNKRIPEDFTCNRPKLAIFVELGEPSFRMQNSKVLDMRFPYVPLKNHDMECEPEDIASFEFQVLMVPCNYSEDGCRNLMENIRDSIVQTNYPSMTVPEKAKLKDGAILNLTLHKPSAEQSDVINGPAEVRKEIVELLTFRELPSTDEIGERTSRLAEIASRQSLYGKDVRKRVMLGCATYLVYPLTRCLLKAGVEIQHSFTDRVVSEVEVNGKIETRRVSKHLGFVGLYEGI